MDVNLIFNSEANYLKNEMPLNNIVDDLVLRVALMKLKELPLVEEKGLHNDKFMCSILYDGANCPMNADFIENLSDFDFCKNCLSKLGEIKDGEKVKFTHEGVSLEENRSYFTFRPQDRSTANLAALCFSLNRHYAATKGVDKSKIKEIKKGIQGLKQLLKSYQSQEGKELHVANVAKAIEFLEKIIGSQKNKSKATLQDLQDQVKTYLKEHHEKNSPAHHIIAIAAEMATWELSEKEDGGHLAELIDYLNESKLEHGHLLLAEFLYKKSLLENEIEAIEGQLTVLQGKLERAQAENWTKIVELKENKLKKLQKKKEKTKATLDAFIANAKAIFKYSMDESNKDIIYAQEECQETFNLTLDYLEKLEKFADKQDKVPQRNVHLERFKAAAPIALGVSSILVGAITLQPWCIAPGLTLIAGGAKKAVEVYNEEHPEAKLGTGVVDILFSEENKEKASEFAMKMGEKIMKEKL